MLKNAQKDFIQRHIGPSKEEQKVMLKELGYNNLDELIAKTVPGKILSKENHHRSLTIDATTTSITLDF